MAALPLPATHRGNNEMHLAKVVEHVLLDASQANSIVGGEPGHYVEFSTLLLITERRHCSNPLRTQGTRNACDDVAMLRLCGH